MTSLGFEYLVFIKCTRAFSKLREWWPTGPYKPFMVLKGRRRKFDFCTKVYVLWLRMYVNMEIVQTIFLTYKNYHYYKTDLNKRQLINRFLFCRQQAEHDLLKFCLTHVLSRTVFPCTGNLPSPARIELCWLIYHVSPEILVKLHVTVKVENSYPWE